MRRKRIGDFAKHSKRGRTNKGKGGRFEREICRGLSLWVTDGKKRDCFWRAVMPGGRATVALKGGEVLRVSGDIAAEAEEGYPLARDYHIECKHLKDINFDGILTRRGKLWKICSTPRSRPRNTTSARC